MYIFNHFYKNKSDYQIYKYIKFYTVGGLGDIFFKFKYFVSNRFASLRSLIAHLMYTFTIKSLDLPICGAIKTPCLSTFHIKVACYKHTEWGYCYWFQVSFNKDVLRWGSGAKRSGLSSIFKKIHNNLRFSNINEYSL